MTDPVLRKTIFLKASRADVWAFLTEPDKLAKWFHAPKKTLEAGQKLEMYGTKSGDLLIWGEVRAARKPEYLEYTFTVKPMGDEVSLVKWTLSEVPGGTQLSLEHSGLPATAEAFDLVLALDNGWDKHFIEMREAIHEPVPA
ncbi:SRPBCC domain-containing protein [Roseobacter sp. YSTF-M11]|uniref:SRPBCC domain-containing protein n=1 Tax=Roseobacter insulae TaxID=2859783 RepID=A0A9X1FSF1_9RHOB|nr:SRPBCC domain-containing protein [Roseobacter insulae]MBW4706534.1 SRPBCC domain-containing protein [Roseobacter insulae]